VYEEPGVQIVKDKHAGDIVGEYCTVVGSGGLFWVAVATDSARDGVGWMRLDALQQV